MFRHLRSALMLLLLLTLITGGIYPVIVTAIGQALFPSKANGSVIERKGRIVGSSLIGQQFASPRYFWGRPSATGPFPYNASSSSGSNLGPLNPALSNAAGERIRLLRAADSTNRQSIPVDLVTSSASGLDPHISLAGAIYQIPRVARERNMSEARVRLLVDQCTEARDLAVLGEPGVNVLELNLALDASAEEDK
jgi:potassium-transporting ATPase KdpC subunit